MHIHDFIYNAPTIGIKVFCLVLSIGFLYDWHVYRAGEDPLLGPNYMYRLIYDTLLGDAMFDNTNLVVFFDAAFTSVKLAKDLYNNRGIFCVGPINANKPSNNAGPGSWPHQKYTFKDTQYLPRGWDRIYFQKLMRSGWLQVLSDTLIPYTHALT